MARSKKGINTFGVYQEEKQAGREALIQNYLRALRKSKAHFKYVTDLAANVADHISEIEGKNCNRATFLRNPRYKEMLLTFMADEALPGAKNAAVKVSESPILQAQLTQLQLANRNLTNENQRLKLHIVSLGSEQLEKQALIASDEGVSRSDFEERFILTCQLVSKVRDDLEESIELNIDTMEILNREKRVRNVIADRRLTAPYIEWLLANRMR